MQTIKQLVSTNISTIYSLLLLHHIGIICEYFYVCDKLYSSTDPGLIKARNYGARFYTMWNFALQIFYILVALLTHFAATSNSILNRIKGYMFVVLVGPCAVFTLTFFWVVYALDHELLLPSSYEEVFSSYLKHGLHTTTFAIFIFEMILTDHVLPKFMHGSIGFMIYHLAYVTTLFGTYFQTGEWIYKLFEVIDWRGRIGIIVYENMSSFIIFTLILHYEKTQLKLKNKTL